MNGTRGGGCDGMQFHTTSRQHASYSFRREQSIISCFGSDRTNNSSALLLVPNRQTVSLARVVGSVGCGSYNWRVSRACSHSTTCYRQHERGMRHNNSARPTLSRRCGCCMLIFECCRGLRWLVPGTRKNGSASVRTALLVS